MSIEEFLTLAVPGLTAGAIYALLAMGYNVIFATTGVLNFAHGEMFMVGTMAGVLLYGDAGLPLGVALGLTLMIAATLGAAEERLAVRPALARSHTALGWVLSTLGVAIILRSAFALAYGPDLRRFPDILPSDTFEVAGALMSAEQIGLIVLAIVVAVVLDTTLKHTANGQALGAVAQDAEAASLRGLPVSALSVASFAIGSAIAALTGFFAAPITGAFPTVGFAFALKGFVAAAVGGIPSIKGALVGGLLLGLVESFGGDLFGAGYRDAVVFATLLAILALRPAGLFGHGQVRAV
ncbi:MAG: branched-chain amino acid ABC transporter permease [Acidimicrobiales bacterium]